jgi:hypothetical protein
MSLTKLKRVYGMVLLFDDLLKFLSITSLIWNICCLFPSIMAHKIAKGRLSTSRSMTSPTFIILIGMICLILSIFFLVSIEEKEWKYVPSLAILNGILQGMRGMLACLSGVREDWIENEEEIPLKRMKSPIHPQRETE